MSKITLVGVVLALAAGCESGSSGSSVIMPDAMVRMVSADMGSAADAASMNQLDGSVIDAGVSSDQGGVSVDDSGLPVVDTCEQICALYETCDRLDIWPNRSAAACMEACESASDLENFSRYQLCLQTTSCDRLQECRLPQRPRPTCPQVCATLAECEADLRLPAGLPEITDCEDACNTPSIAADVRQCGEAYVADAEACDEETFALCLLREQASDCARICEREAECSGLEDVVDCALECVNRPESEDPIVRRRARFAATCAERAGTCDEYLECSQPEVAGVNPDDVAALCEADAMCGFFGDECPPRAEGLLLSISVDARDCMGAHLQDQCGESPLPCVRPGVPVAETCDEYCAVSSLCGQLPDGLLELECTAQCRAAVNDGALNALAPFRVGLRCAYAASCADFSECVMEGGRGDVSCEAHCGARGECQAADEAVCLEDCEARAGTLRNWAERTCTAAAGTCDSAALCVAPPPPPCADLCALREACGEADDSCSVNCDDADYVDSEWFLSRYACLVSTDNCGARALCDDGQEAGGYACLNWCRDRLSCEEQEGNMLECLATCGAGIPGRDGLVFESAYDCLRDAGEDAECEPISACIDAAQPQELCVEFCGEQVRCGLVEDAEDCERECRGDVDSDDTINELQCVLSALRRQAGCAPVAECVGAEVEPASELCQSFCAEQAECNPDLDEFLCERGCTPQPAGLPVRNACLGHAECPEYPICVQADGVIPMECVAACESVAMCDGLVGAEPEALYANGQECQTDCAARAILADAEFVGNLGECLGEVMCEAEGVAGCFEGRMPIDCGSGWDAIVACNNQGLLAIAGINDRASYVMTCEQQFQMDPQQTEMQLTCLIDVAAMANGDPLACFGQLACVLGDLGP